MSTFPTTAGGLQSTGKSLYHSMELEIERHYAGGLFFNANYTLGRIRFLTDRPIDPIGNSALDRGMPPNSITSVFHFNGIADLPFGPGKRFWRNLSGAGAKIVGGWQIAGLMHLQSGQPFTVTAPAADTGTGSSANRAHRIADGRLPSDRPKNEKLNRYFDTTAFRRPVRGEIGSSGVGVLVGPGLWATDVTLMKNTAIPERWNIQFRAEFFNIFNHANFANPNADVTSSAFGRIGNVSGFPRQIQFGARLQF